MSTYRLKHLAIGQHDQRANYVVKSITMSCIDDHYLPQGRARILFQGREGSIFLLRIARISSLFISVGR